MLVMFQAAVPKILKGIPEDFYAGTLNLLRKAVDVCYDRLKEIPCLTCPYKPEGSMFVMVRLMLKLGKLSCFKIAKSGF